MVEIGVAEGGSAYALAEVMSPSAALILIDPYELSPYDRTRTPIVNATKRVAHARVGKIAKGRVTWIDELSTQAVLTWKDPIDLLFIDGDHREAAVLRDWNEWHPFVVAGGVVLFHDACVFPQGWPGESDGPVKAVNHLFREGGAGPNWRIVEETHSLVVVQRAQ
jgi:predicted O-methyltransferase YrrM